MASKIPVSTKPFLGMRLGDGTNDAVNVFCKRLGMSRSEFVRFCILKTVNELSAIPQATFTERCVSNER